MSEIITLLVFLIFAIIVTCICFLIMYGIVRLLERGIELILAIRERRQYIRNQRRLEQLREWYNRGEIHPLTFVTEVGAIIQQPSHRLISEYALSEIVPPKAAYEAAILATPDNDYVRTVLVNLPWFPRLSESPDYYDAYKAYLEKL